MQSGGAQYGICYIFHIQAQRIYVHTGCLLADELVHVWYIQGSSFLTLDQEMAWKLYFVYPIQEHIRKWTA
jgi:hypothetical protein